MSAAAAVAAACALGAPPPGYYDSASGLTGQALKDALHEIIKDHTVLPYTSSSQTDTHDALDVIDEDPNNSANIQPYYRITPMAKSSWGGSGQTGWNREHCWPQSRGADVAPKQSDLHHIFAEEAGLNSTRNNSIYDDFSVNSPTATPGSRDGNSWTGSQFQVRPASRGNVARAILYMTVRYPEMTLSNDLDPVYNQMGRKDVLLQWHHADPPDAQEQLRNDRVYSFQGNRNPFIDHPEYVDLIFASTTDGDTLQTSSTSRVTSTVGAGAVDFPVISLNLQANSNEWDLGALSVSNIGTLSDSSIAAVKLYRDTNANGVLEAGEPLLATGTFSGGTAALTCASSSRVSSTSSASFLLTANVSAAAPMGQTLQFQVTGLTHAASGGADSDYSGLTLASAAALVSGGVAGGDTLNVTASNLAAAALPAGSVNFPLLALNLSASSSEWDVASVSLNKVTGASALADSLVSALKLYVDADSSGNVSAGDTLLATTTFASAAATLTPASPYRVTTTPVRLIVVATISGSVSNGKVLQVQLPSGGIANSSTGGTDNPASFAAFTTDAATVTGGVTDGDSATASATNRAPSAAGAGALDVPMLSLQVAAGSNEWDLGTVTVNRIGTAPDPYIKALHLYHDANGDGLVNEGEALLASGTFSSGAATLNAGGALRVSTTPVQVLVTADLATTAPDGASIGLSLPANAVTASASGGADLNPSFAGFTGGTATIVNSSVANAVKIVMVSTRATSTSYVSGTGSAGNAEFLVLANQSGSAVSLTGWQLKKYASNVTLNLSGTIPPYAHFLIASKDYASASSVEGSTADLFLGTSNILGGLTDTGPVSIGLFDNSGTKVDGFSWGGNATGDTTTPYYRDDPAMSTGESGTSSVAATQMIVRKRRNGGSTGLYQDTNSNAADLQIITLSAGTAKNPPASSVSAPVSVSAFSVE